MTRVQLRSVILNNLCVREWARSEAKKKAEDMPIVVSDANENTIQTPSRCSYKEKVFYARNRKVFLRDYSSYLTIWFPYDKALNSIIKMLGGRWNDRYGNWNLPAWLRDSVEDALKTNNPKY